MTHAREANFETDSVIQYFSVETAAADGREPMCLSEFSVGERQA